MKRWIVWLNLFGTLAALVVIFGAFSFLRPQSFPTQGNFETIARQSTIVATAAMGMTIIILAGGIDLSTGSIVALTTVVIAKFLSLGFNPWLCATGGICVAALCGTLNGSLVVALRVVPFIVTLGTLLIIRASAKGLAHQQKIDAPLTVLNDLLARLPKDEKWKIFPAGVWIMLALVAVVSAMLNYTIFGRNIVAIGSNEQAARLCGIPVARSKIFVYTLGAMFSGVAGLMQFSRLTVGDPTVALGLELDVIAAVVIGGGSLSGGQGSAFGSLIGAVMMTTIHSGCAQMGYDNWRQEIITGCIIIAAVALDRLRHRRTLDAH